MTKNSVFLTILGASLLTGCASYNAQYRSGTGTSDDTIPQNEIEKSFYLIGDAGAADEGQSTDALNAYNKLISNKNTIGDYTIFLGDNIYEKGLPKEGHPDRAEAVHRIDAQIEAVKDFKGEVMFIPGNHDWYGDGLKGLKRQEEYVEEAIGKNSFQPEKGCPIEKISVTDNIVLLVLDTQWYITDWDKHPTINDNCEIKTRKEFFLEIEGELKKNNEKTIVVAMHHPAFTNGPHGGSFSADKHIFPFQSKIPLPILGTVITQVRSQGGVSPQDRYNNKYDELMGRLITLAQGNDRVIFASGHEHSLQYIDNDGIKQIVSGSGSKKSAASLGNNGLFTYGGQGFAVLDVYRDGSSVVRYYGAENGEPELLFSTRVHEAPKAYSTAGLPTSFDQAVSATVYDAEAVDKGNSYEWFWGDHYRYIYGTKVQVPVATLDQLMGGLTIERKGGGHQTRSLRLVDSKGRNFALRAVKKSAVQFLQTVAFKDTYVEEDFKETLTEDLILDFYTSSHPYAGFVVPDLSDAVGIYHTNPKLVYVPKHAALGKYNEEFGDELYIIEERPDDGFLDVASFGKPDAIESTADVLKNLRKDEKYRMDEPAFIRARLFDMLLGDWDRHYDQWRWSRFDISDDERVYRPIPRDRDQVFSNYDGALLDFLKVIMPATKQFQEYDGELKNVKWINSAGVKIDRAFTQTSGRDVWMEQARYIQENLTDAVIDEAFTKMPTEVQDATAEDIKSKLKARRGKLQDIASRYYERLASLVIVTGTDKDDHIEVTRGNGTTKITISRLKDGGISAPYKERVLQSSETKEIWIYGLDDDDQITVNGNGSSPIFTRIIGGQNNDVYTINNGRRVKIYDHRDKPNTIVKRGGAAFRLSNIYSNNIYDYNKNNTRVNSFIPSIGFNPDDGLLIGATNTYSIKGFKNDPFHRRHIVRAGYYFATQGFDVEYQGEFANTIGNWNFLLGLHFASENFTQNFFGFGNDTVNMDDDLDLDFNRVKTGVIGGRIGAVRQGIYGGSVTVSGGVESIEVDNTAGRFITDFFEGSPEAFESMLFGNVDFTYAYSGADNAASPTRGMLFKLKTGVTTNLEDTERTYGYIHPSLIFYNALTNNRKLVLKTMAQGQFNIGDNFEFYQAARLGANTGLRGFREQRFAGNSALAFGADLRYSLAKFKTGLLPLKLGVFGGYDYGRVWLDGESSNTWHDSVGGGLWLNAVEALSGQFGFFNSDDGLRVSFGFGISF